jgi:hypothetical protein
MQDDGASPRATPHLTAAQQPREDGRPVGIPFRKGDPRINRKGRARTFEQFRTLAQRIAAKEIGDGAGNLITVGEAILRTWAKSKEPVLQKAFIEYAFGKVPDKLDTLGQLEPKTTLILHYGHEKEKRDAEHRRLSAEVPPGADRDS